MIRVGDYYTLPVVKEVDFGRYLRYDDQEILLPSKYVPEGTELGDELKVFVYTDSEDRLVATTLTPKGIVGEFVPLKAVDVAPIGAFMDMGLEKDLFIPPKEQRTRIERGETYVVRILLDKTTNRMIGSTKVENFFKKAGNFLKKSQKVELLVYGVSDLGASVIVDESFGGMVFHSDIYRELAVGDRLSGFIKNIRPDGKLDISLKPLGKGAVNEDSDAVLAALNAAGGSMALNYKSSPDMITIHFSMSKKAFKAALTKLVEAGKIEVEEQGIRLKK